MCHRGSFIEDINKKCILCKDADNGIKNVANECKELKREREIVLIELNHINNTYYNKLLISIEYHYYSRKYGNGKNVIKDDNRGLKIIKEFINTIYKLFGINKNEKKMIKKMKMIYFLMVKD